MAGVDGDRLGRVDEETGEVLVKVSSESVYEMGHCEVLGRPEAVRVTVDFPHFDARVRVRRHHQRAGEERVRTATCSHHHCMKTYNMHMIYNSVVKNNNNNLYSPEKWQMSVKGKQQETKLN